GGKAAPLARVPTALPPPPPPPRPHTGLAANNATPASTSVLRLGPAFGPSQRPPQSPPLLRPLPTSPRRAATSRPPPSQQGHPWRPPRIRPATVAAHPPHLRRGPSMRTRFGVHRRRTQCVPAST